jgi:hypothetical protein
MLYIASGFSYGGMVGWSGSRQDDENHLGRMKTIYSRSISQGHPPHHVGGYNGPDLTKWKKMHTFG